MHWRAQCHPNIAFQLRSIWLQTLVDINSESCHTSFQRFSAPPSEVAALFDSNLSRRPFLGQVIELDLLLCTGFDSENVCLFLFHVLAQRQMADRKIERSDVRGFSWQNFRFAWKKKCSLRPKIYKALKPCWLLNWLSYWVSIAREIACFAQASRSRPAATAADFGEIARWPAGAQTWTQTWTLPPDQRVLKVL